MRITHASKYAAVIDLAEICNATEVSIQYHIFVNFKSMDDAVEFRQRCKDISLDTWDINTQRPFVPFEVIVSRF